MMTAYIIMVILEQVVVELMKILLKINVIVVLYHILFGKIYNLIYFAKIFT